MNKKKPSSNIDPFIYKAVGMHFQSIRTIGRYLADFWEYKLFVSETIYMAQLWIIYKKKWYVYEKKNISFYNLGFKY